MDLGCGTNIAKFVLFVFNLLCLIFGLTLITIGGQALSQMKDASQLFDDVEFSGFFVTAIIVLGIIITLISFLGCYGAIGESPSFLNLYSIFLTVFIVAMVMFTIGIMVNRNKVESAAEKVWEKIWIGRNVTNLNNQTINAIQEVFSCCGNSSYIDYKNDIPKSCYPADEKQSESNVFKTGCGMAIKEALRTYSHQVSTVAMLIAVGGSIGIIFSCYVSNGIRYRNRYEYI